MSSPELLEPYEVSPTLLDWNDIANTDEYENDYAYLLAIVTRSFGNDYVFGGSSYVAVLCHMAAIMRYYINHFTDIQDIDLTPFLAQMQQQLGFDLPFTTSIPVRELLKESRSWNSHVGTEKIYQFIGALCNSRITLYYPRFNVFTWSSPNTFWSGIVNGGAKVPPQESFIGVWPDYQYWSDFVFVIQVLDAQNILNWSDFTNLVMSVHPLGLQEYVEAEYWRSTAGNKGAMGLSQRVIKHSGYIAQYAPVWDNGWVWSEPVSIWSGRTPFVPTFPNLITKVIYTQYFVRGWKKQWQCDYLTPRPDPTRPWVFFSRQVNNNAGGYTTVYADNDAIVMDNVVNNIGFGVLTNGVVKNLTAREVRYASNGKDGANLDNSLPTPSQWNLQTVVTT